MPKVSVVVASYNHSDYIEEAIQSVLDQTFQDFEIVIVDDASTDDSVKRIKQFKDKRIRLIVSKQNKGQFSSTNQAIQASRGKYISILNSDDVYLPDKLKKQVEFLDTHPKYAAVFSEAHLIDDNGANFTDKSHFYFHIFRQSNKSQFEWLRHFFYFGNALCHPSSMVRKNCHQEIGLYNESFAQIADLDLWIRICLKYNIFLINEKLIKFRVRDREKNMSGVNVTNTNRFLWEYGLVLQHYLKVNTTTMLLKIFPEVKKNFKKLIPSLIPFYIADLALQVEDSPYFVHQHFALDIIYDLLKKESYAKKIYKNYSFKTTDFIYLTGKFNLFNLRILSVKNDTNDRLSIQINTLIEKINKELEGNPLLHAYLKEATSSIKKLVADSESKRLAIKDLEAEVENLNKERVESVEKLQKDNDRLRTEINQAKSQIKYLGHSLNVIKASKFFKLWRKYCSTREKLVKVMKTKSGK